MSQSTIKSFNISGPCNPVEHYMSPVLSRQTGVNEMIEGKYYFILHAPHQSGKTTFFKFLTNKINSDGNYYALTCSLLSLRNVTDEDKALTRIVALFNNSMSNSQIQSIKNKAYTYNSLTQMADSSTKISTLLKRLCEDLDKDLVVFFDEADCLSGPGLITFLSQIRDAYQNRDEPGDKFLRSVALVGQRDIRDYLVQARGGQDSTGVASMFNIIKKDFTLPNFTQDEIANLYHQHTEASGQAFEANAVERAWYWSEGQPWLVNALAYESVVNILRKNYSQPITSDIMNQSADNFIQRRDNHLDTILERLKEPRVRAVMEPIIIGANSIPHKVALEDIRYTEDLGIIKNSDGIHQPSNPIYNEVIIRSLSSLFESQFAEEVALAETHHWVDGKKLDMTSLLKAFQQYWRENSGILTEPQGYAEALAHLVLNAFLQTVLNSGVIYLRREYGLGKGRMDLYIEYNGQVYPIELKIKSHKSLPDDFAQIKDYMGICGAKEGWLVIFDAESKKSWDKKITWKTTQYKGSTIHLIGC